MLPPNSHELFNPQPSHRPLTTERIRRLLAAMARFGDDPWLFGAVAHRARMSKAAPGLYPPSPELEIFDPDPAELAEDHERLTSIWGFSESWGNGGAGDARSQIDERLREMEELRGAVAGMFAGPIAAEMEPLRSITIEELEAVEALAAEIRPFFSRQEREPEPSDRIRPEDPEAREWLAGNGQEAPLAANRFGDAEGAREFVEELYAAGAERVVIASECINDDEHELSQGGPYADGLRVKLPRDPARRRALFEIVEREVRSEGFDPEPDTGQEAVFLWWD